jgi:hypothetical protein
MYYAYYKMGYNQYLPCSEDTVTSISVSKDKLDKGSMTVDDWMLLTNRADIKEKDMIKLLDWFIKHYPSGGITLPLYKQFFPATTTGENIAGLVFR